MHMHQNPSIHSYTHKSAHSGSNTSKHFVPGCPQCFNAINGEMYINVSIHTHKLSWHDDSHSKLTFLALSIHHPLEFIRYPRDDCEDNGKIMLLT